MDQEIRNWAKSKIELGYTKEQIADYMIKRGYSSLQVNEILQSLQPPAVAQEKNGVSTKTLILMILLIVLLGVAAMLYVAESRGGIVSGFIRGLMS